MKILKTSALSVLSCLCILFANAQQPTLINAVDYNKPKIFADLPNKMQLNTQLLEKFLNYETGEKVQFVFTPQYNFQGTVVSKSDAADLHTQTVVIKSTNRQGVTLTFTRNRNHDGSFSYIGRLLSFKHGDAFEIAQEGGQLVLLKKDLHDLFDE